MGNPHRVSYAVVRSLARHHIPSSIITAADGESRLWSMRVRASFSAPDASAQPRDFDAALLDAIARTGADLLAPCSDAALAAVGRNDRALRALVDPGAPPPDVIDRVLDKRRTLDAARPLGIAVPETYDPEKVRAAELPDEAFPAIAKARSQSLRGGFRLRYLDDRSQLEAMLLLDPGFAERYVVQRFVSGRGEGVALLMRSGAPLAVFQHRRVTELPSSGGVSVVSESVQPDASLVRQAVGLLQALEWDGVAQVEFRRDASGVPWLMEVNGRYWGSLETAIASGVDFPYYRWQIAHGEAPSPPEAYRIGVRVRWTRGAIMRMRERLFDRTIRPTSRTSAMAEVRGLLVDFSPMTRSAMAAAIDPLPAILDTAPAVGKLAVSALRAAAFGLVPRPLRRAYRRFGFGGMLDYARFLSRAGRAAHEGGAMDLRSGTILFVCSGNIMRSPLAAAAFARALEHAHVGGVVVESCGLHAADGTAADPRAIEAARRIGLDLSHHRARRLTAAMVDAASAIVVMERFQAFELLRQYPQARPKLFLLGTWVEGLPKIDLADPYLESDAEAARLLGLVAERATALGAQLAVAIGPTGGGGGEADATRSGEA